MSNNGSQSMMLVTAFGIIACYLAWHNVYLTRQVESLQHVVQECVSLEDLEMSILPSMNKLKTNLLQLEDVVLTSLAGGQRGKNASLINPDTSEAPSQYGTLKEPQFTADSTDSPAEAGDDISIIPSLLASNFTMLQPSAADTSEMLHTFLLKSAAAMPAQSIIWTHDTKEDNMQEKKEQFLDNFPIRIQSVDDEETEIKRSI